MHSPHTQPQADGDGRPFRLPDTSGPVLVHAEKRGPAFTPVLTDSERIIVWDALQTAGELLQHLDLGRVQCAIAAYKRLQQAVPIQHAAPVNLTGLPPDAGRRALQEALSNINALDARRHWYGLACVMFTIASLQVTSLQKQIDFAIQHETGEDALEDGPSDAAALKRQQAFFVTFMAECQGVQ